MSERDLEIVAGALSVFERAMVAPDITRPFSAMRR